MKLLLKAQTTTTGDGKQEKRKLIPLTYNGQLPHMKPIFQRFSNPKIDCSRYIFTFKCPPSLRRHLVHSNHLGPLGALPPKIILDPAPRGFTICSRKYCRFCSLSGDTGIIITRFGGEIQIGQQLSCDSRNLCYYIRCKKCCDEYVGQTTIPVRERFYRHRSQIYIIRTTSVGKHFSENGHSFRDVFIVPFEGGYLNDDNWSILPRLKPCL